MNRLELYGLGLLLLILAIVGSYAKGHHVGYMAAETKAESALAKANEKADELQKRLDDSARVSAQKYEDERTKHEQELVAARTAVSDRLCRRTPNPVKVPASIPATSSAPTASSGDSVPRPAQGTDDWRFAFVAACQHDRDALAGWQEWWRSQQ